LTRALNLEGSACPYDIRQLSPTAVRAGVDREATECGEIAVLYFFK
jgi:hypothetical protein